MHPRCDIGIVLDPQSISRCLCCEHFVVLSLQSMAASTGSSNFFPCVFVMVCLNSLSSGSIKIDASQTSRFCPASLCPLLLFFFSFLTKRMKSRRITNVTVQGGTPAGRLTAKKKETHRYGAPAQRQIRSQGPSRQSRQGARLGRVHVHPCCRLEPERLSPKIQPQDAARARRKTDQASIAFTKVSTSEHAAPVGPNPPAQVEQSVVIGGLREVLLDYGEDVEGKPAGEREGELIKRRQVGQEMRRHDGVAEQKQRVIVRVVLVIIRGGVGTAGPHGTARHVDRLVWRRTRRRCLSLLRCRASAAPEARRL